VVLHSGFEKFLWIGRFVRGLPDRHNWRNPLPFTGGTEEELIAKGAQMCNENARVMIALCQVAGLPARYVGHPIGGHGVTEVYVNGRWSYYDIRGKFFVLDPTSGPGARGEPTP
jgi:transglutaminase-like putative cysteine protease